MQLSRECVGELRRLRLQKGDVLILKAEDASAEAMRSMRALASLIRSYYGTRGKTIPVVVLGPRQDVTCGKE